MKRVKRQLRPKRGAIAFNNTLQNARSPAEQSVYAEFGRRLQSRMIELGWNQSELARRASAYLPKPAPGQKQGHEFIRDRISHYVRGVRMPRPEGLAVLAKALGVQPADLVPPGGVPYAGKTPPSFELRTEGPGRVMLRVNRVMTLRTATKISALIDEEDRRSSPESKESKEPEEIDPTNFMGTIAKIVNASKATLSKKELKDALIAAGVPEDRVKSAYFYVAINRLYEHGRITVYNDGTVGPATADSEAKSA